jgi:3-hydroxybutyryl-CoA dehydrogenase
MDPENVKTIAVIGAGVMGQSISIVFASAEIDVTLVDVDVKVINHAMNLIESGLNTLAHFGKISKDEIPSKLSRINFSTDLREIAEDVDFVIEAVPEVSSIKKKVFATLDELCGADTVLASNTSGLDIFNIVEVKHPERLVITHWFSPAHIIPLVEVVPGVETSSNVVAFTVKLLERLGKRPIVLKKFVPSFIVNRIQNAINKAVFEILENGWATPEDIDMAMKNTLGIRLPIVGVAQALDFTGLDLILDIMNHLGLESQFIEEKVKQGCLGAKTSKGIYDYGNRSQADILKKRDRLYFKMLDHLEKIKAFEPV